MSKLVLSRKAGQAIVIGDDIRVTIVHIGESRVRIAIEAPRETNVARSELIAPGGMGRDALPLSNEETKRAEGDDR